MSQGGPLANLHMWPSRKTAAKILKRGRTWMGNNQPIVVLKVFCTNPTWDFY